MTTFQAIETSSMLLTAANLILSYLKSLQVLVNVQVIHDEKMIFGNQNTCFQQLSSS